MGEEPGIIVLFGSGETSSSGRKVFDWLFARLRAPIRVAILEAPAGFQPNSAIVAGKVADFLRHNLQNYQPEVVVVPARQRGTPFSPDDPAIVAPILPANAIFLGPGSPTYAVRQLQGSMAWHTVLARQRLGAALVLASAATIAASVQALPVYEIYKSGEDLHWRSGLDLFGCYGLSLVFVPHWDNEEGGEELDTSHCFMGRARFGRLLALLPPSATIVGIDEHTAVAFDLETGTCRVMGRSGATLVQNGEERRIARGQSLALNELGPFHLPEPGAGLPAEVWSAVQAAAAREPAPARVGPPAEVVALVTERGAARARRDWAAADALRVRIAALGWQVQDTPAGPQLEPLSRT